MITQKIPKKTNVLELMYTTIYGKDDIKNSTRGQVNYQKQTIKIHPDYAPEVQLKTYFHEIIHIIDTELTVGLKERQTELLESGIYQVFKANGWKL